MLNLFFIIKQKLPDRDIRQNMYILQVTVQWVNHINRE